MVEGAHHLGAPSFDDLHDFAFSLFVLRGTGGHGHAHEIAVEGLPHVRLPDEELFVAVHRLHETKALGVARKNARPVPRVGFRRILPALTGNEVLGRHFGEHVTELQIALVVFNVEALRDLVGPIGLVRIVLQKCDDVLAKGVNLGLRNGVGIG
jgi:hypothetical protein